MEIILSINAGSSSVKISVYKAEKSSSTPTQLAEVTVEGLTAPPAKLKYSRGDQKIKGQQLSNIDSQEDAFKYILEHLQKDDGLPELSKVEDIHFSCHRVVHGGDYPRAQIIDKETYHHIEELSDLAPLHNTPALSIVRAVSEILPGAKNIAYFDSSFHATIPKHICTYPIDQDVAEKNKLRKYGFHGISYQFITDSVRRRTYFTFFGGFFFFPFCNTIAVTSCRESTLTGSTRLHHISRNQRINSTL